MNTKKTKTDYGYELNGWHILDLRHLNDKGGVRWTVTDANPDDMFQESLVVEDFWTLSDAVEFASRNAKPEPKFLVRSTTNVIYVGR